MQRNEMEMRLGPAKGKDTATTLGPWLVTKDEIEPWRRQNGYDLEMVVSVNGREYGRDKWANAYWSIGEIISYASRGTSVRRRRAGHGHVRQRLSGRAAGARRRRVPWLAVGDEIVYEVERLGRVANRIVAGPPLIPLRP